MSLDEDSMKEQKPAELTRTELTRRELKAAGEVAKAKSAMGLPLSDAERLSLKTARLIADIREEKS